MELSSNKIIAVIGLGYVGLPLALAFSQKQKVLGYDNDINRIVDLKNNIDKNEQVNLKELDINITFTSNHNELDCCNIFIITLPTPIDKQLQPDLTILKKASYELSLLLKPGNLVIYESTVFPGCTEDIMVPILEKGSGLKFNKDFFCGYSPERIDPGSNFNSLTEIKKITSGSTEETSNYVDKLYSEIIVAGTFKVDNIKIAEAAKVIENTQRDLNIALINEFSIIFNRMNISTEKILQAAETKWNFHKFRPGLVGGHCIGVDPYYLTYKSQELGYNPEIILAGRKLNNYMSSHIVNILIKKMIKKNINIDNAKILIMGITFKENCPDIRNSKVFDIIRELDEYNIDVDVFDPYFVDKEIDDIKIVKLKKINYYDSIILAVGHNEFKDLGINKIKSFARDNCVIYDLKYIFKEDEVDLRL